MNSNLVDTELEGIIKVFETSDGARFRLTSESGMSESISLKAKIWDYIKCFDDSLKLETNSEGLPVCYSVNKDGETMMLKHSSVPKMLLREGLDENDFLAGYPPMLPNTKLLDLSYAIECELKPAPTFWFD